MTRLAILIMAGILALPARASAATIRVENDRGVAQFTYWQREGMGDRWFVTDGFGRDEVDVEPGDVLRIARTPGAPRKIGPPEGPKGQRYTVPNPVPREIAITLPHTGPIYKPGVSKDERWVIRKANEKRAARGRPPLRISKTLSAAAGSQARQSVLENRWPPSFLTAFQQDFGWPAAFGAVLDSKTKDRRKAIGHWTDGSIRERTLLDPRFDSIGVGSGNGWYIAQVADCPEGPEAARCRLQ